ncbi:MAG: IS3 family transposase [Actinomycetes bacterium]
MTCSNEPWPSGSKSRRRREPLPLCRCPEGRRVPSGRRLPGGGCLSLGLLAWATRCQHGPRPAEHAQAELVAESCSIHADSAGTYGSPRVTHELRRRGWRVNHKQVERLMAAHGIVGHRPRRRRGLTKADGAAPPAPDLLGRLFDPDRIDMAWCGDVTFIPTDQGWLYLASVLDLASRHLLGWSMGERHDAGLVTDALQAAVATRGRSRMDSTIFHAVSEYVGAGAPGLPDPHSDGCARMLVPGRSQAS